MHVMEYTTRFPFLDLEKLCTRLKSRKESDREYISSGSVARTM